mmetsp:Transcript_18349/g.52544  ORF Transcript_18349/g.52544 Transcript_18349/m.52544 type:complete len:226 (-) Transcript_18349:115-792(-)
MARRMKTEAQPAFLRLRPSVISASSSCMAWTVPMAHDVFPGRAAMVASMSSPPTRKESAASCTARTASTSSTDFTSQMTSAPLMSAALSIESGPKTTADAPALTASAIPSTVPQYTTGQGPGKSPRADSCSWANSARAAMSVVKIAPALTLRSCIDRVAKSEDVTSDALSSAEASYSRQTVRVLEGFFRASGRAPEGGAILLVPDGAAVAVDMCRTTALRREECT